MSYLAWPEFVAFEPGSHKISGHVWVDPNTTWTWISQIYTWKFGSGSGHLVGSIFRGLRLFRFCFLVVKLDRTSAISVISIFRETWESHLWESCEVCVSFLKIVYISSLTSKLSPVARGSRICSEPSVFMLLFLFLISAHLTRTVHAILILSNTLITQPSIPNCCGRLWWSFTRRIDCTRLGPPVRWLYGAFWMWNP